MDPKKVFISFDSRDIDTVEVLAKAMKNIGLKPYIAPYEHAVGKVLSEKIKKALDDSNFFVPLLTKNSMHNQWVNQEAGYAFAMNYYKAHIDHGLQIFAIVDKDAELRGFLTENIEHIPLKGDIRDAIPRLLASIRKHINESLWGLTDDINTIYVACKNCGSDYKMSMPSEESIDRSISQKLVISSRCKACSTQNNLDPRTFEIVGSFKVSS